MSKIIINKKEYTVPQFDMNDCCELERLGLSFDGTDSTFSMIRAIVALTINSDLKTAGIEIQEHLKDENSDIEDFNLLTEAMDNSVFIKSLLRKKKTK